MNSTMNLEQTEQGFSMLKIMGTLIEDLHHPHLNELYIPLVNYDTYQMIAHVTDYMGYNTFLSNITTIEYKEEYYKENI